MSTCSHHCNIRNSDYIAVEAGLFFSDEQGKETYISIQDIKFNPIDKSFTIATVGDLKSPILEQYPNIIIGDSTIKGCIKSKHSFWNTYAVVYKETQPDFYAIIEEVYTDYLKAKKNRLEQHITKKNKLISEMNSMLSELA